MSDQKQLVRCGRSRFNHFCFSLRFSVTPDVHSEFFKANMACHCRSQCKCFTHNLIIIHPNMVCNQRDLVSKSASSETWKGEELLCHVCHFMCRHDGFHTITLIGDGISWGFVCAWWKVCSALRAAAAEFQQSRSGVQQQQTSTRQCTADLHHCHRLSHHHRLSSAGQCPEIFVESDNLSLIKAFCNILSDQESWNELCIVNQGSVFAGYAQYLL